VKFLNLLISILGIGLATGTNAQFVVSPSDADACQCTGSVTFTPPAGASNYSIMLFDQDDELVQQASGVNGPYSFTNLCPTVFHVLATLANGTVQDDYFNVPAGANDPGSAEKINMCLEQYPNISFTFDLLPYTTGFGAGGTWSTPEDYIIPTSELSAMPVWQLTGTPPNQIETLIFENGWYVNTTQVGGCPVNSGVYIQTNDVGLTTTYLACDTYEPFEMIDFMQGSPDTIGQWYNSTSQVVPDGIFYPETMDSELFTYVIDNLPGCSPVFRSMYVSEQVQRSAGRDSTILVCAGSAPFNMLNYLQGNPDDDDPALSNDGYWTRPGGGNLMPMGNDIFNPASMQEGVYTYITNSPAPCATQSATLSITFTNDNPSGLSDDILMCSIDGPIDMLDSLGGNPLTGGIWTNAAGVEVDGTFNPQLEPAGNYEYYYPNVGCTPGSSTLTISVEAPKNAGSNGSETMCESGPPLNLNSMLSPNATLGGTWELGNTVVGNMFMPSAAVNATFTYEVLGIACPDDDASFIVYVQPAVNALNDTTIYLCSLQDPIQLDGFYSNLSNVSFQDVNGAAISPTFDPEILNTQDVTVINLSGNTCPDQTCTMTVTVVDPVIENGTSDIDVCRSNTLFDLNSTIPAAAVGLGTWEDISGNPLNNQIPIDFMGSQSYVYSVVLPITCGGEQRTVVLETFTPNDAGPDDAEIFCYTDGSVGLSALLPAANQPGGQWYFNGSAFSSNNFDPGNDTPGNYIFRLPANGPCPADEAVLAIAVQQGINYTAGNDVHVCAGSPAQLLGAQATGGTTYSWSPTLGLSNPSSAQPSVQIPSSLNQTSTVTYSVFADDGICTFTDYVNVITEPNPVLDIQDTYDICYGDYLTLSAPGDATYQWTPVNIFDNANSASPTLQPAADVYIAVEAESAFGCTTSASAHVIVHPLPVMIVNPETLSGCPPILLSLTPESSSSEVEDVVWTVPGLGVFIGDSLDVAIQTSGVYDIQATAISPFNCTRDYFYEEVAEVYPKPSSAFTVSPVELTTLEPLATFNNHTTGGIQYNWTFDEYGSSDLESPEFEFPNERSDNFLVCLEALNLFGCYDTICRNVYMDAQYAVFAPNAFSPDGDGDNDAWIPVIRGFTNDIYELMIFNRWGDVIFRTQDPREAWTGEHRDGDYFGQNEVYNWRLKLRKEFSAEDIIFQGSMILMR
jgi:gliding motility-associated-like protein